MSRPLFLSGIGRLTKRSRRWLNAKIYYRIADRLSFQSHWYTHSNQLLYTIILSGVNIVLDILLNLWTVHYSQLHMKFSALGWSQIKIIFPVSAFKNNLLRHNKTLVSVLHLKIAAGMNNLPNIRQSNFYSRNTHCSRLRSAGSYGYDCITERFHLKRSFIWAWGID